MMFNFPFYSYYPRTMYKRYMPENRPYAEERASSNTPNPMHANDRRRPNTYIDTRYTTNNGNVNNSMYTKHVRDNKEKSDDRNKNNSDDKVFEILGLKLHFDDILLICLIFFLYNEGVKDESLFIALILLLLS